ncbi:MAG: phage regulatory CII family protein [Limisphaerales bacterium]
MKSHEVLREVFKGSSPKQIADVTGLSLSMIYKWSEEVSETGSGATNPLDRIAKIINATDDPRLVQWICERAGGFFIRNPDSSWPHEDALIPATNQILQDFANLLSVVAHAASDNHISKDEARRIRAEWEALKSVAEGFVNCCEEGNFRGVAEGAKRVEERHR